MADKGDLKFAVYKTLDYLSKTPGKPRTSKQILDYLQRETLWGKNLEEHVQDGGIRNVQNLLKSFGKSPEFQKIVECTEDYEDLTYDKSRNINDDNTDEEPPKRRENLYHFVNKVSSDETMKIEEACCIAMAEKFLVNAMPKDFIDTSLNDLYSRARETIKRNENHRGPRKKPAVKSFVKRIEIAPRGQQLELIEEKVPYEVLNTIYSAILGKCCLEMRYGDSTKVIHPYAVIIREPKFYLLGVEDAVMRKVGPDSAEPRLHLCNRIEDAVVTTHRQNRAPADYSATDYVKSGKVDIPLWPSDNKSERKFTLELVVYAHKENDRLLQDLEDFPLSKKQTISKEPGTENYLLTARDMRATHQLVEWIIGRMERVEVKAPEKLRIYVGNKISAMQQRYAGT
jgi:hypothetical protein